MIPAGTFGTEVTQAGTGPFILDSYTPDEEATMVRNEDYWGEKALLDRLIIRPIADPAARLQALQGGSIQGYDLVSPSDYEAVTGGWLPAGGAALVQHPVPGPEPRRTRECGGGGTDVLR